MKVSELTVALEEFREKLAEHSRLWADSLDPIVPSHPERNIAELQQQSQWLSERIGALRPYIERFRPHWTMQHPATGVTWDALDAATGLAAVGPVKGPSMRQAFDSLNQIIGLLQNFDQSDEIPADPQKPMRSGLSTDRIILAYLNSLHPFIMQGCSQLYRDGHYAQAVEEAAKAVFQYIRNVTGLAGDGASLVQAAFTPKNPILAFSDLKDQTKQNEQVGFMEMLCAFAKGVRHPLTHTHGRQEEAQQAFEYLVMASLFCRRIDDAAPKPVGA